MTQNDTRVINQGAQPFVQSDEKVEKKLGRHHYTVQVGRQGRLFKDGAYVRDLPPGQHTWWDFFHDYTVSTVDSRVVLLPPMLANGTVPGPIDQESQEPTPPCKVQIPMRVSVQLADIDTLLNTNLPLKMLDAMILNHITQRIG